MIHLFTDFGWSGPYIGEMHAVLEPEVMGSPVIDLMHDAPVCNPKASAYLLAALAKRFSPGDICLAVVDPGVGDERRRVLILEADDCRYVGPDNGLFAVLARRAQKLKCYVVDWRPKQSSNSFHGRDIFAPITWRLQQGEAIDRQEISCESIAGFDYSEQLAEIIYIDHFGNAVTGLNADRYPSHTRLSIAGKLLDGACTFSNVGEMQLFWYANSMGLIEIAANRASAAELLSLSIGSALVLVE